MRNLIHVNVTQLRLGWAGFPSQLKNLQSSPCAVPSCMYFECITCRHVNVMEGIDTTPCHGWGYKKWVMVLVEQMLLELFTYPKGNCWCFF